MTVIFLSRTNVHSTFRGKLLRPEKGSAVGAESYVHVPRCQGATVLAGGSQAGVFLLPLPCH